MLPGVNGQQKNCLFRSQSYAILLSQTTMFVQSHKPMLHAYFIS
jgi:hypothetical protein